FQVLGDLPRVAHDGFAVPDDRHRLAAGEREGLLVAHQHRMRFPRQALVLERHLRAPRVRAIAPAVAALQFPELDHAAFLTEDSFTSWLSGRALMRRSFCSCRSRGALR